MRTRNRSAKRSKKRNGPVAHAFEAVIASCNDKGRRANGAECVFTTFWHSTVRRAFSRCSATPSRAAIHNRSCAAISSKNCCLSLSARKKRSAHQQIFLGRLRILSTVSDPILTRQRIMSRSWTTHRRDSSQMGQRRQQQVRDRDKTSDYCRCEVSRGSSRADHLRELRQQRTRRREILVTLKANSAPQKSGSKITYRTVPARIACSE